MQLMIRVKNDLASMAQVETDPKLMGRNVTMTLAPLPSNKRRRRFSEEDDLPPMPEDDESDD
jgi:translation initiation factor IF-3